MLKYTNYQTYLKLILHDAGRVEVDANVLIRTNVLPIAPLPHAVLPRRVERVRIAQVEGLRQKMLCLRVYKLVLRLVFCVFGCVFFLFVSFCFARDCFGGSRVSFGAPRKPLKRTKPDRIICFQKKLGVWKTNDSEDRVHCGCGCSMVMKRTFWWMKCMINVWKMVKMLPRKQGVSLCEFRRNKIGGRKTQ